MWDFPQAFVKAGRYRNVDYRIAEQDESEQPYEMTVAKARKYHLEIRPKLPDKDKLKLDSIMSLINRKSTRLKNPAKYREEKLRELEQKYGKDKIIELYDALLDSYLYHGGDQKAAIRDVYSVAVESGHPESISKSDFDTFLEVFGDDIKKDYIEAERERSRIARSRVEYRIRRGF